MKRNINHIIAAMGMALGVLSLSSCIEETYPKNEGGAWADQFLKQVVGISCQQSSFFPHHLEYLRR